MGYTTILFDFDHTLFDSDASERAAFEAALNAAGIDEPREYLAPYQRINRQLWAEVEEGIRHADTVAQLRFERLASELLPNMDPVATAEAFRAGMGDNGGLYPGARAILEELSSVVSLALITNGIGRIQRSRIERCGIAGYFDAIVISGEVGTSKPGSEIFEIAFENLGSPPKESAVMVGDSLTSDIRGGADFGIDTVWYNRIGAAVDADSGVTHQITSLEELTPLVLGGSRM